MKIYYQGEPGSYSHLASREIQKNLNVEIEDILGVSDFDSVWNHISQGNMGVLPIENSYAGSIHQNVYNFLSYDHSIIGEYNFEVNHCLLSLEDDISKVTHAYSHHQALSQTDKYLKSKNILPRPYADTAGAAKMIREKQKFASAAVASDLASELYNLNILERNIQDQAGNTTKFLVVIPKTDTHTQFSLTKGRVTLLFKTDHTPGSLYRCLGILAENGINMTKIESIPMQTGHFSYSFWVTIEGSQKDEKLQAALQELKSKTEFFKILGEY